MKKNLERNRHLAQTHAGFFQSSAGWYLSSNVFFPFAPRLPALRGWIVALEKNQNISRQSESLDTRFRCCDLEPKQEKDIREE